MRPHPTAQLSWGLPSASSPTQTPSLLLTGYEILLRSSTVFLSSPVQRGSGKQSTQRRLGATSVWKTALSEAAPVCTPAYCHPHYSCYGQRVEPRASNMLDRIPNPCRIFFS